MTHIVGVQFRNLATVGGSIFGKFGFSDVLSCFWRLTVMELHHEGIIPLDQFAANKYSNDILVRLIIKHPQRKCLSLSHRNTKPNYQLVTALCPLVRKVIMRLSVQDHPELAESDYQISGWNRSKMMKEEKTAR